METVNKVVDAGYKALWGEDTGTQQQQHATATGSTADNQSSFNAVVDAGKKALWGNTATGNATSEQQSTSHGEEPVSGERGLGTATDPYDAGNREEEEAVSNPVGSKNSHTTEQRNVELSQGASSGTTAEPDMLKTTVTGLKRDPSEPSNNVTDPASRVIVDNGPGQSLKHTSAPFQKESDRLVEDLQGKTTQTETSKAFGTAPAMAIPSPVPAPAPEQTPVPAAVLDKSGSKSSKEEASKSSFSGTSSDASGNERQEGQRERKTSKLEKVKNKLHIGSPKAK
jgi:hypothetical protein